MSTVPQDVRLGLWAWYRGRFYGYDFEEGNPNQDHANWFGEIGLPQFGRRFDEVIRGRMEWEYTRSRRLLTWYGTPILPNHIYDQVIRYFEAEGREIIERFNACAWT